MTEIERIIKDLEEYHNPDDTHRMIALLKALNELNWTLQEIARKP